MRSPATIAVQAGLLLALAGLCAVLSNLAAGPARRLAWTGRPATDLPTTATQAQPPASQPQAEVPADPSQPVRDIDSAEAWRLFQGRVPFLDARRAAEYAAGHVQGAWNLPVWEAALDARIAEFEALAQPASTAPLVLYCDGGDCQDSHLLAARLSNLGYRNLLIYKEGFPDWARQGRPVAKGDKP